MPIKPDKELPTISGETWEDDEFNSTNIAVSRSEGFYSQDVVKSPKVEEDAKQVLQIRKENKAITLTENNKKEKYVSYTYFKTESTGIVIQVKGGSPITIKIPSNNDIFSQNNRYEDAKKIQQRALEAKVPPRKEIRATTFTANAIRHGHVKQVTSRKKNLVDTINAEDVDPQDSDAGSNHAADSVDDDDEGNSEDAHDDPVDGKYDDPVDENYRQLGKPKWARRRRNRRQKTNKSKGKHSWKEKDQ